jgi:catechol 2,3-dioxygenase-like lactoylglutathione lyase family enzyme
MLRDSDAQPMLPVKDLEAAERFYEEKLGFHKVGGLPPEAVVYRSGNNHICVYRSKFAGTNQGTAAMWEVDDVDGAVKELKAKGIAFEHYDDMPGTRREGDVHLAGPMRVAWFKDPSGNILSIQNRPQRAR